MSRTPAPAISGTAAGQISRGPARRASPAASSTARTLTGPASTAAARSHVHAPRRAASGTNDTPTCHKEREEMSQQDFEPDANAFTASPEFTGPGFSTPGHDTWTSHEHPGNADQYAPGGWGSPHEYGQPEEMNGQGVFVPGHDDTWGTAPTPPYGTPRHGSARRIRLGPLAIAVLALISVCVIAVITLPHARAIRLTPADDPGATASQHAPSVQSGRSSPPAEPPAITRTGAERVLANYWRVNNAANQSRSDALLATIEAGSSYTMDAGAYQMSRVTDPSDSQYAPFTAENAVYYIPRQPAGVYPRWFAARVTYATLASPQHATGTGYVLFIQDSKDAAWKNVLEPYLLSSAGPAPFIETDSQGYAIQAALTSAAGLTASPAQIPQLTAQSLDGASAALKNPGNLADLRDQAYFQARLPAGSAVTDRHGTSGLVFALKTVGGGALVFYHLTARLSLTPPPGQTIQLSIPGYYSSSQALTFAAVDYADQFASYIPPGSAGPAIVADASGITGQG